MLADREDIEAGLVGQFGGSEDFLQPLPCANRFSVVPGDRPTGMSIEGAKIDRPPIGRMLGTKRLARAVQPLSRLRSSDRTIEPGHRLGARSRS